MNLSDLSPEQIELLRRANMAQLFAQLSDDPRGYNALADDLLATFRSSLNTP